MADSQRRVYKPAPPHNSLKAPASCMCLDCCRIVLDLRCQAANEDSVQCGDYKGHKKSDGHTMLVCTTFLCAEERLQHDGSPS